MKKRPSSRLLVLNSEQHLLLFKFEHKRGPLAGQAFWATPGGGVDEGESFEDAARRELYEEVGMRVSEIGTQVAQRTAIFAMPTGEMVEADERYFLVRADTSVASDARLADRGSAANVASLSQMAFLAGIATPIVLGGLVQLGGIRVAFASGLVVLAAGLATMVMRRPFGG